MIYSAIHSARFLSEQLEIIRSINKLIVVCYVVDCGSQMENVLVCS